MERTAVRTFWLALVSLLVAAFLALPGLALADEADDPQPEQSAAAQTADAASADEPAASAADSEKADKPAAAEPAASEPEQTQPAATDEPAADPAEPGEGNGENASGDPADPAASGGDDAEAGQLTDPATGESSQVEQAEQSEQSEPAAEQAEPVAAQVVAPVAAAVTTPAAATVAKKAATTGKLLVNGYYLISSAKSLRLVVTVKNKKKGANVYVVTDSNKKKQRWYFKWDASAKAYVIKNASTGKYLTVADGKKKSGTNVIQWNTKKVSKKARLWTITVNANGGYVIKSKLGSIVLDLNNGKKTKSGANVDVRKSANGASYQRWYILPYNPVVAKSTASVSQNLYLVQYAGASSSQVVNGNGTAVGSNVNSATKGSANSQKWAITDDGDGFYHIVNVNSGKSLAVNGAQRTATTNIVQAATTTAAAQKWAIHQSSDGSYVFVNKATGMAMDLAANSNGANIRTYFYDASAPRANEKFKLSTTSLSNFSNGLYYVAKAATEGQKLTSSATNGAQLSTASTKSDFSQKYMLTGNNPNGYTLQSVNSGKYVTDASGKVTQKDATSDSTQLWKPEWDFANKGLSLVNASTGAKLNLGSSATTATNGTGVALLPTVFINNGNKYHLLSGSQSSSARVINISGSSTKLAANDLYTKSQKFKITNLGNNRYSIKSYTTGGDLLSASVWVAEIAPNGGMLLKNEKTGKYLNANPNSNSTVTAAAANKTAAAQHWYVEDTVVLKKYQERAYKKVVTRGAKFKHNYYLIADVGVGRMMIWERANKNATWKIKYDFVIAWGRIENGKTRTPLKDSIVYSKKRWLDSAGAYNGYWSAPWAVRWSWASFHARTHGYKHKSNVLDKRLGKAISNGCIRMEDKYAKWMYYNFKAIKGAPVTVWQNGHF